MEKVKDIREDIPTGLNTLRRNYSLTQDHENGDKAFDWSEPMTAKEQGDTRSRPVASGDIIESFRKPTTNSIQHILSVRDVPNSMASRIPRPTKMRVLGANLTRKGTVPLSTPPAFVFMGNRGHPKTSTPIEQGLFVKHACPPYGLSVVLAAIV
ncbi:hypothetical protein DPMN_086869 [Dreissena polymorpha]|uniref:Uncharacterized protein n=1 Tax=Dreissena polymorpha TaxID=45954 RepID=A0A9D4KR73_DREPO|nr:hypothetical protein DPMN_086869 [Dreissena polymorpha]